MTTDTDKELAELAEFPEMNPGPVCRLDAEGRIVRTNQAASKLFGETDLQGSEWRTICPGITPGMWKRILTAKEPLQHEADFGGQCVLFTHVRSRSGETIFAFGTDVTSLRKVERQLAEVARFPEMNPGPVLRVGLHGTVLLANQAARKIFGEQIVGSEWPDVCPGMSGGAWTRLLATTEPVSLEATVNDCVFLFTHRNDPSSKLVFVFGVDITKQKLAEKTVRQSEKMATLGTLAAGVAHELNNPAAATKRAAEHMKDAFAKLEDAMFRLDTSRLSVDSRRAMTDLATTARDMASKPNDLDPLSRSDLEADVEAWLEKHGIAEPWDHAPSLVAQGLTPEALTSLAASFEEDLVGPAVIWIAAAFPVYRLLHEIGQGSGRISEIVAAMKGYSYVGQAPLRMIDIHEGIDNTLVILRSKLKQGVTVTREYDTTLPKVCAFGSELNQVWTNLLDNAIDAMNGNGTIRIRTTKENGWARVDIEDDGPGIPESVQSRVFDPFFTTKAPGQGTGLGLSTTYSIVKEKHLGEIAVASRPGSTTFTVKLLIDNPALAHDQPAEKKES